MNSASFQTEVKTRWHNMPAAEKEVFLERRRVEAEAYKARLAEWVRENPKVAEELAEMTVEVKRLKAELKSLWPEVEDSGGPK